MLAKEVKRFFVFLLTFLILSYPISLQAKAYTSSDVVISKEILLDPIRYVPHYDFGDTSVLHMNHALYSWNEATGKWLLSRDPDNVHFDIVFPNQTPVGESDPEYGDHNNYVYHNVNSNWRYKGLNVTYVQKGITYTGNYNVKYEIITESDININMYHKWANSAQPGAYDLWSVFLHESGHTIGLGDRTSPKSAVMYEDIDANTEKRELTALDLYNVDYIYG